MHVMECIVYFILIRTKHLKHFFECLLVAIDDDIIHFIGLRVTMYLLYFITPFSHLKRPFI